MKQFSDVIFGNQNTSIKTTESAGIEPAAQLRELLFSKQLSKPNTILSIFYFEISYTLTLYPWRSTWFDTK